MASPERSSARSAAADPEIGDQDSPEHPDAGAGDEAVAEPDDDADAADPPPSRRVKRSGARTERPSRPRIKLRLNLTAAVAAVLVILVGVGSWLFLTRPIGRSPIELTAFDEILSAARSGVVDVTSFDYLTLDQDLAEIEAVTTGDLRDELFGTLDSRREQLVTDQQVSSTEVIAASLTGASPRQATALIVLRARQKSLLTPQETVTRYRVEVTLEFVDGSWLLSGLTGR